MGPVRERIAAVFANGRQGSGYVLSAGTVLTAAHVVGGTQEAAEGGSVSVALPGRPGRVGARVVWWQLDAGCDAALLLAEDSLLPGDPGPVVWGEVGRLDPLPGCQAIGFPYVQRRTGDVLESEQLVGTVKPGSSLIGGGLVLDSDHAAPAARPDGGSPWAGLSGAALFHGDLLLGVVSADPHGWRHGRVEATPVGAFFQRPSFRAALARTTGVTLAAPVTVGGGEPDPDAGFEAEYAHDLRRKYGTLTIFGLDLRDRSTARWPLDATYLSLEASSHTAGRPGDARPEPYLRGTLPADQALAGRERVLLRGVAGSGKTTLVQWLAVSAAQPEPPEGLAHLRGRIPFVLPLRKLIRHGPLPTSPEGFLTAADSVLAAEQPQGWARRVLKQGRGLVMVDGLDEISEAERYRVREWLGEMLSFHPGNLWLVTSRPSAVDDAWLADEGFTELTLSPMSRDGIASFVARWHGAARATIDDAEERERLDGYEDSLLTAIRTKQDLGRLATNPLMCGMICALHRDRRGYLPHGRKELYDAALAMLTADRDQRRDIGAPDGIELTAEPQIQLLQRLAYWLILNGRSELDRDHAEHIVAGALPSVPAAASQGDAPAVLEHLLLRSGVIREPTSGTVDFIHRTFQDYLGARRAVEEWDIGVIIDKAADTQWEDVVRMTVAHARPRERAEILRGLIDRPHADGAERARVSLLALACLEHATELDPAVRRDVERLASSFVPPHRANEAATLAAVGPLVLELLPGPEGCPDEETAVATVTTACSIGTDAAIPLLRRFREHPSRRVRVELMQNWNRFEERRYFDEVVSHLPEDQLFYVARSVSQLRLLHQAGGRPWMVLQGDIGAESIGEYLGERLTDLVLIANTELTALDVLARFPLLRSLEIEGCSSLHDQSALSGLPLTRLYFAPVSGGMFLSLARLPAGLTDLHLRNSADLDTQPDGRAPGVTNLRIDGILFGGLDLAWLVDAFPAVETLHLEYVAHTLEVDISPLAGLTALRSLEITGTEPSRTSAVEANGVEITSSVKQPSGSDDRSRRA
jgi:NACHT domain